MRKVILVLLAMAFFTLATKVSALESENYTWETHTFSEFGASTGYATNRINDRYLILRTTASPYYLLYDYVNQTTAVIPQPPGEISTFHSVDIDESGNILQKASWWDNDEFICKTYLYNIGTAAHTLLKVNAPGNRATDVFALSEDGRISATDHPWYQTPADSFPVMTTILDMGTNYQLDSVYMQPTGIGGKYVSGSYYRTDGQYLTGQHKGFIYDVSDPNSIVSLEEFLDPDGTNLYFRTQNEDHWVGGWGGGGAFIYKIDSGIYEYIEMPAVCVSEVRIWGLSDNSNVSGWCTDSSSVKHFFIGHYTESPLTLPLEKAITAAKATLGTGDTVEVSVTLTVDATPVERSVTAEMNSGGHLIIRNN